MTKIFSSKAKSKILRVLSQYHGWLALRHLAYLSKMSISAIQSALIQLEKEKWVIKKQKPHYTLFKINEKNVFYEFVCKVFELEKKERMKQKAKQYKQKAISNLLFCEDALGLFREVQNK